MDRFWDKADKSGECWNWMASLDTSGYGIFKVSGRNRSAHRMAYELSIGPIEPGMQIDHLCRNRKCVNPAHLEQVTQAENIRRGDSGRKQAAKTHCPRGHEYSTGNVYAFRGRRNCRECGRMASRSWRERNRLR